MLVHTLLQLARILDVPEADLLPGQSVPKGSALLAIEAELRQKLDLPAGVAKGLVRRFNVPSTTADEQSSTVWVVETRRPK